MQLTFGTGLTQNEAFSGTLKPLVRTEFVFLIEAAVDAVKARPELESSMSKLCFELAFKLLLEVRVGTGDLLALLAFE